MYVKCMSNTALTHRNSEYSFMQIYRQFISLECLICAIELCVPMRKSSFLEFVMAFQALKFPACHKYTLCSFAEWGSQ